VRPIAGFAAALAAFALLALAGGCSESEPPASNQAGGGNGIAPAELKLPMTCRLLESRVPGVAGLRGVAIGPEGRICLAGQGGATVFDRQWQPVARMPTPGPATAVAVSADGQVFVAEQQKVRVFDPLGEPVASWGEAGKGPGQLDLVTGIAVDAANVWLADAGNRVVHRFDATGDFIDDLGGRDPTTGRPGLICPSPYLDCAAAPDGTLYVCNPGKWRVEHYDLNGKLVDFWGRQGMAADCFQGCCNPTNLALMPGGNFVTAEKGVPRVKVLDPQGRLLAVIGNENFSEHGAGLDLAVDSAGRIYVADPGGDRVLVFELQKGT
jgi:DNA-binding beta-propeller fold protein YncE